MFVIIVFLVMHCTDMVKTPLCCTQDAKNNTQMFMLNFITVTSDELLSSFTMKCLFVIVYAFDICERVVDFSAGAFDRFPKGCIAVNLAGYFKTILRKIYLEKN